MKKGTLVISLDFELIWGIFDHVEIKDKVVYFDNTLNAIPQMLTAFEKNDIHVTWSTVGMLFNENWDEWNANIPQLLPTYKNSALNPYDYGKSHQKSDLDRFFFAPQLIKEIQCVKGQEIGTHTYSHYYCLEEGQTVEQFDADLQQAFHLAEKFNVKLKSLVFPRNQFNENYLEVCAKHGIDTVRTNPSDWYWDTTKQDTILSKIARTGDAYFSLGKKSYARDKIISQIVTRQQASRFFRPQSQWELLNKTRLNRIKNEIINAAKKGEIYHLWWHPHNFGLDTVNALKGLNEILDVYNRCKQSFGMESMTMEEIISISDKAL